MPTFTAPDGTRLAHRMTGGGAPLVCPPGGPAGCGPLGDLNGLAAYRRLVLADPRGTGGSERPADASSYRCDRQVADVEALRAHLRLERFDLLAHAGGADVAVQYAARHPVRVRRLVLVAPSTIRGSTAPRPS
ncbi:alpha/beta fold hydrolase [Streptomyces sp. NPDC021224]|uniref:alpha/beta fold hydrolase n=1 Tax=unclassified Streptomyces TaxID=2593676 RepID=UPI003796BED7